jgi:hypothetical protein
MRSSYINNEKVIRHRHIGGLLMRALIILVPILLFQINIVFAQSPYIREGSIGKQNEPKEQIKPSQINPLSFRPLEKCVGEKFIFLPKSKDLQKFGYQSFHIGKGSYRDNLKYEECVGRIGTITKASNSGGSADITIQMDDNGQVYIGFGYDGIDGIAPVADMEYARDKWLGKTLWYGGKKIDTYDETTDKFGSIKIRKFSTVKVVDVVAGWDSFAPIRFILQTPSGEEGFQDVTLSGTNVSYILREASSFNDYFFTENPKKIYKWSSKIWTAIDEEKVFVGMTAKQVRMSWGTPQKIYNTITGNVKNEQWVYHDNQYLYFQNGVLTGIHN